jgi:hypothetical protein
MQPSSDSLLKEDFIIPIPELRSSTLPGIVYVSFTRLDPEEYSLASFACTLKFISKEVDPSSGEPEEEGYDDEYQLEEVELGAGGDYIVPSYATFTSEWEQLQGKATATETFSLGAMDGIKGETHFEGIARTPPFALTDLSFHSQPRATRWWKCSIWNPWEVQNTQRQPQYTRCNYPVSFLVVEERSSHGLA